MKSSALWQSPRSGTIRNSFLLEKLEQPRCELPLEVPLALSQRNSAH